MRLERVTTQYDSAQDRFRVLGSTPDGETLALWLTQRLFIRVIRFLLEWLEEESADSAEVRRPDNPQVKSSLQNFAQQGASASMQVTEPVEPQAKTQSFLMAEVDIRKNDQHVVLVFKLPEDELAEVPFDATQLRQWLHIIFSQWQLAEWPLDFWPLWMRQAEEESEQDSSSASFH